MCLEHTIREPYGVPQYRHMYIEDYDEDTSVLFFKIHHCYVDAISGNAIIMLLSDDFNPTYLGTFRPIPFYMNILIYITLPYYIIRELIKMILRTVDNNVMFKAGAKNTGRKKGAVSFEMDFM